MPKPATKPLPEEPEAPEQPPPISGEEALDVLLEDPAVQEPYSYLHGVLTNFLVSGAEMERVGTELITALAEAAETCNAVDYPLFRRNHLGAIAEHFRGTNQYFAFRTIGYFTRLPRGPEFARTMAMLADVDPEAHLIVALRLKDAVLFETAHSAIFARLDSNNNAIAEVEPLGDPERLRAALVETAGEQGVSLNERQIAALVRVLSYELGRRRHLWGDTFKWSKAKELAHRFIGALKEESDS